MISRSITALRLESRTISFAGTTTIQDAAGSGVDIQNTTGDIYFENLNVDSDAQTGLSVRNASHLEIDRGKFNAINNGSAIDIQDSTIDIVLESVNVDGGPFGIRLINTPGRFFLAGDSTNVGSAGLIQNTTTGLIADNVESLTVQLADFDSNGTAISATDLDELTVTSTSITNSTAFGIDARNAQALNVSTSVFTGNGSTDIRAQNDVVASYSYNILQNTFSNNSADAIQIASLAGGEGANLAAVVRDNSITLKGAGATGLNVDWNGVAVVRAIHNNFIGTAANTTAIDLTSNHLTALSQYFVQKNTMTFSGANATGLHVTTAGPSQTTVNENTITFNAAQGTGLRFDLAESANVAIYDNTITDNVSRGTGMLFDSLDGPSNVTIMNNSIKLLSTDGFVDQGIIFSSITDTITLFGNESNTVIGASTVFSIPLGTSTGSFVINNFRVP